MHTFAGILIISHNTEKHEHQEWCPHIAHLTDLRDYNCLSGPYRVLDSMTLMGRCALRHSCCFNLATLSLATDSGIGCSVIEPGVLGLGGHRSLQGLVLILNPRVPDALLALLVTSQCPLQALLLQFHHEASQDAMQRQAHMQSTQLQAYLPLCCFGYTEAAGCAACSPSGPLRRCFACASPIM